MKKTITAVALATLIVSPAIARSVVVVHQRDTTAHAEWGAPRGAVSNGGAAIRLEERKDAQSDHE